MEPHDLAGGVWAMVGSGLATWFSQRRFGAELAQLREYVGRLAKHVGYSEALPPTPPEK